MEAFLKAMSIFHIVTAMVEALQHDGIIPSPANVASATHEAITAGVQAGHLPADFRDNTGSLVADVIAVHPQVDNALVHPPINSSAPGARKPDSTAPFL